MCSRKWLMVTLVVCGLASACSNYNTNLSIQTSSSILSFVSPGSATVGSQGFTITANGSGFTTGALILWNGKALTTTLVSSIQLTAPVPATDLATAGTVQIAVQIPGSAQSGSSNVNNTTTTEVSNVVLFTISAAPGTPPSLTSLSPTSAPFCGNTGGFTLTVNGTGFTNDSMVNWNGSPRATAMSDSTKLTATILPADTSVPSPVAVTVSNSGGTSNALQFTISSAPANLPAPQSISSLMPSSALAGSAATQVVITGTGTGGAYLPCSVVKWMSSATGATTLPTQYVSASQLKATIPASDLQTPNTTAQVVVFTPAPGGGTTSATFTITQPPTPTISSLSSSTTSSNTTPGCSPAAFTLTVNGTNFVSGSLVNWNGSSRPTTFVDATHLTAVIPITDTVAQGSATITVSNGSAVSNPLPFSVTAPSSLPGPAAASSSPPGAMAGSGAFTLTVTGSNFVPCSKIQWNGPNGSSAGTTTYLSPTQLSAPAVVSSAGTAQVTVVTPGPGGGISNAISFTISALSIGSLSASTTQTASTPYCAPAGFTLTVTAGKNTTVTPAIDTTFTSDTVVSWNGSPRPTTFVDATHLTADITYADTAFPGPVNVFVANSASTSASMSFTLSAPTSLPVPSINPNSLQPSNAPAGGLGFALTVIGTNLLPCSTVQWNGATRTTTFASVNGLSASIPAADISAAGTAQVTVNTPPPSGCVASKTNPCGGPSNAETFTVFTPAMVAVRRAGISELANSAGGRGANGTLLSLPLMSADHRYAVHVLASTDGVAENPGSIQNIFVRDTCAGAPSGCVPAETLVSVGLSGNPADGDSLSPSISADGRYVAFLSYARNLVDSDTNGVADVFVRDTCAGAPSGCMPSTQRASVAGDGTQANGPSTSATIGSSGRYVTFASEATNLGASAVPSLFLRDTCAGTRADCVPSTQPLP